MSFLDTFNSFKAGTALKNPADAMASQVTALTGQVTNPAAAAAIASVTAMLTDTQTKIGSMVSSLRTQLPVMTAADGVEKKLGIAVVDPNGASQTFNKAFAPFSDISTQIGSVQSILTPDFISQLNSGDVGAISSLQSTADNAQSTLTTSFATANTSSLDGLSTLQADSYASFVTSPTNPPYVQSVLDKVKNWAT
jgi:hypothetical protein